MPIITPCSCASSTACPRAQHGRCVYTVSKEIDDMIPSVNGFPGESFSGGAAAELLQSTWRAGSCHPGTRHKRWCSATCMSFHSALAKPLLNQGGVTGKVIGGWQINGNTTFQSGFPLQINGGNGSGSFAGTQRPNWNGNECDSERSVTGRLAAVFRYLGILVQRPVHIRQRSSHDAELALSGVNNFDISVFKNTTDQLSKFNVQFRAEAFNAFNRVQFGVPNTSINSTAFGVVSSQQNLPRNLQLGLRLLVDLKS